MEKSDIAIFDQKARDSFAILKKKLKEKGLSKKDFKLLEKSFTVYLSQTKNHDFNIIKALHPIRTALILSEFPIDVETIVSAIIHNIHEETPEFLKEIQSTYGNSVSKIVSSLAKLGKINFTPNNSDQDENLRKIFVAMAEDIRVILIKISDRLDILENTDVISEDLIIEKAKEGMEIYAPIADRLGVWALKSQIEDMCFSILDTEKYSWVENNLGEILDEYEKMLNYSIRKLKSSLKEEGLKPEITSRIKSNYSIYKKSANKYDMDISQVYDLAALRVITNSIEECYKTLGIIHKIWTPVQKKFKDFIAVPKQNGYQSLHTTVFSQGEKLLEIQIRTKDMHLASEYGIAAHWRYDTLKEGKNYKKRTVLKKDFSNQITNDWVKKLSNWDKEMEGSSENYEEGLKTDIFGDNIFVFTPKGDVVNLPEKSTPVDMAYKIHTGLGDKCMGAKVNGKMVELDHQLNDSDVVEIISNESRNGPSRDWLNFVVTNQAKTKIRQWIRKQNRDQSLYEGKKLFEEAVITSFGKDVLEKTYEYLENNHILSFKSIDSLLSALGDGIVSVQKIIKNVPLIEFIEHKKKSVLKKIKQKDEKSNKISVAGDEDLSVSLAKCCNPSPPDLIIGFLSREKGTVVHKATCKNLLSKDMNRLIKVDWRDFDQKPFFIITKIKIVGDDRKELLYDILDSIKNENINIEKVDGRVFNNQAEVNLDLEFCEASLIPMFFSRIKKIKGVEIVERVE